MSPGAAFDLAATNLSIRECAACNEPVCGAAGTDGAVAVTCGYCGREDVVDVAHTRAVPITSESVYRGRERGASGRGAALVLDLSKPPPGFSARQGKPALRAAWIAAKATAPPEAERDRGDHDHRLTWLATSVSMFELRAKELVRARAVLESALDLVATPPYRALLLARLARLAALAKSPALGRAWLALVPAKLRAPEVTTDVLVAEAFVAREESGPRGVLDTIGHGDAVDSFSGPVRLLAAALRTDAHEKLGERRLALQTWTAAARAGSLALGSFAALYGLAPETRKLALRRAGVALVVLAAAFWAFFAFVRGVLKGGELPLLPIAILVAALVVALIMKATRR